MREGLGAGSCWLVILKLAHVTKLLEDMGPFGRIPQTTGRYHSIVTTGRHVLDSKIVPFYTGLSYSLCTCSSWHIHNVFLLKHISKFFISCAFSICSILF